MNEAEFDKLANELFGDALLPHGFTSEGSRFCTFHRKAKANEDVHHLIMPDIGSRGVWYDIKVAAVSPKLDPLFDKKFPDEIGMFTNNLLSKYDGVGITQQQFNCKTEENFRRLFEKDVRPLLENQAIPFLDKIQTIGDLLPLITIDFVRGLALHSIGKKKEAVPLLEAAVAQFSGEKDPDLKATVHHIEEILKG
ncbi:MAG: hypothetical protein K1X75_18000 [Leptospirales bacterium]|nr:hypothetical protein [Leptospirales bacterium]